jgi:hypothetical protein
MPGDYDADGATDLAVWRPTSATWYVNPSSAPTTYLVTPWGIPGDIPAVNTAPSIAMFETTPFSRSSSTLEAAGNLAATPSQSQARPLSEAEIGAWRARPVEQAAKRLSLWMPPDLQRQVGEAPNVMTRPISDAPQFIGVPPNMRPEEVGKRSVLPLPPADQKRP